MVEKRGANGQETHCDRESARPKRSLSMHEGIAVWCDCCSCEAEERWVEVGEKMGIDLSDYESEQAPQDEGRHTE